MVLEHSKAKVINLHNPLDLGDMFNMSLCQTLLEKTIARDDIDGVLFIHLFNDVFQVEETELVVNIGELTRRYHKPIAVCVYTTKQTQLEKIRKAANLPIFSDPREAIRALAVNRDRKLTRPLVFSEIRPENTDRATVKLILDSIPQGPIGPDALATILSAYGIPIVPGEVVNSQEEALDAAQRIGYPIVLKTAQPEVIHKSDVGGVHLGISNEADLRSAYRSLVKLGPRAQIQKMSEPGMEWLIGGRQNQQFGPVLVVGLGGINVEIFNETSLRIAPIDFEEAGRMVDECRGSKLLSGVRGKPSMDREALHNIAVRISWLLTDFPEIQELDLNPVHVFQHGCLAVDWRARKG
jgi:acetyltransferase